jgi:hypothetical protein
MDYFPKLVGEPIIQRNLNSQPQGTTPYPSYWQLPYGATVVLQHS